MMMYMTTLGVVCWPQVPPERLREVALAAENAGMDELWLWEDCFWGGAVPACAAALAWTSRLTLGIGVLPVPLRNVAATTMDTAMLHRLFPGRVTMGVGHGVQSWMGQIGAAAESPMTLLREHLAAMRALLRGEKLTVQGPYVRLDEVALEWPVSPPPPILAAARGPRTLRLSGELADGSVLDTATGPDEVRNARALVERMTGSASPKAYSGTFSNVSEYAFGHTLAGPKALLGSPAGRGGGSPAGEGRRQARQASRPMERRNSGTPSAVSSCSNRTKFSRMRIRSWSTAALPSRSTWCQPFFVYPVFRLTASDAGLSANAADVMWSNSRWSNRNAHITWRMAVPMPFPWNSRLSHDPVSPVRVTRKSFVMTPWVPTSSPSQKTAKFAVHFSWLNDARTCQ